MSMMVMSHINIHTGPCVSVIDSTCRYDEPRSSWPFDDECRAAAEQLPGPLRHVTDRQTDRQTAARKERRTDVTSMHTAICRFSRCALYVEGAPRIKKKKKTRLLYCAHIIIIIASSAIWRWR